MNLASCSGEWLQDASGYLICQGSVQIVSEVSSLPELTYADANILLASVAGVFALVWVVRQMGRLLK